MSERGGKRPGAGRPKGAKDRVTREAGATIGELARAHTAVALRTLAQIATSGESEAARVSAANALLDRGYGKATQPMEHTGKDGGAIQLEQVKADAESFTRSIAGIAARTGEVGTA